MFALALAAAMPAAQAIGKSKACDDPVHCFALDVFGDTCQSVREEATTPNGADVALYPQWVPVGEVADGSSLEAGIGLPLGVQLDDPLACWDGCVAHLITELVPTSPFITDPHRFDDTKGHEQATLVAPHAEANSSLEVPSLLRVISGLQTRSNSPKRAPRGPRRRLVSRGTPKDAIAATPAI